VSRAKDITRRVVKTGREEELDPMNPYERKIVHDAVAEVGGAESSSRGEEPERRVVIRPKGQALREPADFEPAGDPEGRSPKP
jgi:spoIIIJ-associated protein